MQTSVGESGRKWEIPGKLIPARSVQKGAYVLWTRHFLFRCHNLSLFVIQRCNEPTSCTDSQLFKWNCDTSCRRCCTKCKLGVEKVVSLNANFEFKFIMNRENWKFMKEWNGNGGQRVGGWLWWEHYCKHPSKERTNERHWRSYASAGTAQLRRPAQSPVCFALPFPFVRSWGRSACSEQSQCSALRRRRRLSTQSLPLQPPQCSVF